MEMPMSRPVSFLSFGLVCAVLGAPPAHPVGPRSACSITLSGAQTGTMPCTVGATWRRGTNESLVTLTGTASDANFVVKLKGEPATQQYTSSDATSGCGLMVRVPSGRGAYWYLNRDYGKGGTPPGGSYELVLSR